jgi:serine phosphatase RsbU (regulator of sigma subunit)
MNDKQDILNSKLELVNRQSLSTMIAMLIVNLMISFTIEGSVKLNIWYWFLGLTVFSAFRFFYIYLYLSDESRNQKYSFYFKVYFFGSLVLGLFNAVLILFFFPADDVKQNFVVFVMAGLIAGSIVVFAPIKIFYYAYFFPSILAIIYSQYIDNSQESLFRTTMVSLFGIMMFVTCIRVSSLYNKSFTLRFENLGLIENLKTNYLEIAHQKEIIEYKNKEITDSINYAERILSSFLASKDLLSRNLNEYFILFSPKDIVSGDFYLASELSNGNFAIVTADSTGHGVPGAIMSLLNITALEKAIETEVSPDRILNQARTTIIERLKKDGSSEGGKDGMDCSIVSFNSNKNKIQIASANNAVWIIRNKQVIEVKADKMPVGKHDRQDIPFGLQEVDIQNGDVVYSLTDGFPDQFGGEKGKKFMRKNLKSLFLEIAHLPMTEQRQLLENTFEEWKGDMEQVDDVTIVGIRV